MRYSIRPFAQKIGTSPSPFIRVCDSGANSDAVDGMKNILESNFRPLTTVWIVLERTGMKKKKVDGEMSADDEEEREHLPTLLGLQMWGLMGWW